MRVIGYVRVSTEDQALSGISPEAQKAKIEVYSDFKNYDLVGIEIDAGKTGKNLDRPGIKAALKCLKEGRADGLLVAKLDRLTRSVADVSYLLKVYFGKSTSLQLLSCSDSLETRTASGRLMIHVMVAFGQCEQESIVERTNTAVSQKRSKGERLGTVPYGFDLAPEGTLKPNATEQRRIATMHDLYEKEWSCRAIARYFNEQEHPTKHAGCRWHASTIRQILLRKGQSPEWTSPPTT